MQPTNPTPQSQQPNFQQASQSAIQNANQPQQPSPSIDPQVSESIIQRLQDQSSQIEQAQDQVGAKSDLQSMAANQYLKDKQTAISKALGSLNDKSEQGNIGRSIATPAYAGYCLQWVDDQQGNTNRQPTAIADFNTRAQSGDISTKGAPPPGSRVYFAPDNSNGGMGHVGIMGKNGNFTSATDNGVQTYSLKNWESYTGQKFIGYSK